MSLAQRILQSRPGLLATICGMFLAALLADLAAFALVAHQAPFAAAGLAAALVTAPASYALLRQRRAAQRTQASLADGAAQKNRAIDELEQRRQEAEQSVAEAERTLDRLGQSEALYRLLADNQTDVISLWTPDRQRKYTSPSAKRALGYQPDELLANPALLRIHPEDSAGIDELLATLTPGADPTTVEYRLIHRDGMEIWVETTFRKLDDDGGDFLSTSRVITRRKELERALMNAVEDAKAAVQAKSDFLANMTHELRTPLNAIIGFSQVLQASQELTPVSARQVELIADASQTLLGVVNDVLDFSRLEAGAVEPELHPIDPAGLVESTVEMLAAQAAAKGVALQVSISGPGERLMGDAPRLRQVLLNFLSNAIKFTGRGAVRVRLSQSDAGEARRLRVEVEDSGIGISPEQMTTVFDRFTQADASTSRQYGGTGLGLAISKRIMEALGGVVGVESQIGAGSTFWFEITLERATAADALADAAPAPVEIDAALRILVVDDNAINRELICILLAPFDLEIETAKDGVEAVETAQRTRYDLILMDVQMPNMDGLAATRRIREGARPGAARPTIVAMTANVLPDQVARCLEAGMDSHLGKPIIPAKLLEVLAGVEHQGDATAEGAASMQTAGGV